MKLGQIKVLHLFLLVASTSLFTVGCGDVKELSFNLKNDKSWEVLLEEGRTAKSKGNMAAAEAAFQQAADKCAEKFGEDDGRTGTCVGYLAELYRNQQEWLKARKAYRRWLTIMDKNDPTGEQMKVIRKGYKEIKRKIRKYGLDVDEKKPEKEGQESSEDDSKDDEKASEEDSE